MPSSTAVTIAPARRVRGRLQVPGDKSISHRYAMLAALAEGATTVEDMVPRIYPELHPGLFWAAAAQLRAHVDKLLGEGRVVERDGRLRAG